MGHFQPLPPLPPCQLPVCCIPSSWWSRAVATWAGYHSLLCIGRGFVQLAKKRWEWSPSTPYCATNRPCRPSSSHLRSMSLQTQDQVGTPRPLVRPSPVSRIAGPLQQASSFHPALRRLVTPFRTPELSKTGQQACEKPAIPAAAMPSPGLWLNPRLNRPLYWTLQQVSLPRCDLKRIASSRSTYFPAR